MVSKVASKAITGVWVVECGNSFQELIVYDPFFHTFLLFLCATKVFLVTLIAKNIVCFKFFFYHFKYFYMHFCLVLFSMQSGKQLRGQKFTLVTLLC